jgi:seryl-tRNA synthetase
MAELRRGSADQVAFRDDLLARGLLLESGVPGLYGRGSVFEDVRVRLDDLITREVAQDAPEIMRFPPVLPRALLERTGYLHSFPHLAGTVFAFEGDEAAAVAQEELAQQGEEWSEHQRMTAMALVPAACYPVYPALAARGPLPPGGIFVDAGGAWVFRHEPAEDPARMQSFHQRELVRLGLPEDVREWRDGWCERGLALLRGVGLAAERDRAADPFFGRGGRMLAANQLSQELKFELLVQLAGDEPTAVTSFNYHQQHFAEIYDLRTADGALAHTACVGFGQERIVLALLWTHGLDPQSWPAPVRDVLWPAL